MKSSLRTATVLLLLATAAVPLQPALADPASEETAHVVQPGETLNGIANRAGVSASAIARANGLEPPYVVKVGQTLAIPRGASERAQSPASTSGRYTVTNGETLGGIANRTGVPASAIARANNLEAPYVLQVGQTLTIPRKGSNATAASAPSASTASASSAAKPAARAVADRPAADGPETYTVKPGETLGGIANRTGVPRVLIAEANGLQPPYAVKSGQVLHIPRTRHHTVAKGDTGFTISLKYGVPWEQIALASGIDDSAPLSPGQKLLIPTMLNPPVATAPASPAAAPSPTATPSPAATTAARTTERFVWPVKGPIRRGFATGTNYHDGIDITAPKGAEVRAAAAGTVRFAANEQEQFGNLVVIDHGDGWFTAYAFLSRISVKKGARVDKGQRIGLVGNTGLAQGYELHFELRKDGKPVNPVDELPKAP